MIQEKKERNLYQVVVPEKFYTAVFNGKPKVESHPNNNILAIEVREIAQKEVYVLLAVTLDSAEAISVSSEDDTILIHGDELKKVMFYLDR